MSGWTEDAKVSGITPKPPCSAESTGTVGTSTVGGSRFYPPSGGASRAFGLPRAAAGRLVAGRSPDPLCDQRPNDREKKIGSAIAGIEMPLTKRNRSASNGVRTNTRTAPVWAV